MRLKNPPTKTTLPSGRNAVCSRRTWGIPPRMEDFEGGKCRDRLRSTVSVRRPGVLFVIGFGFGKANQTIAVGVDLLEQLLAEQKLLAGDVAVAVAVHF